MTTLLLLPAEIRSQIIELVLSNSSIVLNPQHNRPGYKSPLQEPQSPSLLLVCRKLYQESIPHIPDATFCCTGNIFVNGAIRIKVRPETEQRIKSLNLYWTAYRELHGALFYHKVTRIAGRLRRLQRMRFYISMGDCYAFRGDTPWTPDPLVHEWPFTLEVIVNTVGGESWCFKGVFNYMLISYTEKSLVYWHSRDTCDTLRDTITFQNWLGLNKELLQNAQAIKGEPPSYITDIYSSDACLQHALVPKTKHNTQTNQLAQWLGRA